MMEKKIQSLLFELCWLGLGLGFRVWGLGFGVWGLGFGVRVRVGVWGLGFGVWGLGLNININNVESKVFSLMSLFVYLSNYLFKFNLKKIFLTVILLLFLFTSKQF